MPNFTRQLIAEIWSILFPQEYDHILKWNRNQPRGEKGTREGGRWVSRGSHGADAASAADDKYAGTAPGMGRYATRGPRGAGFSTMDRARAGSNATTKDKFTPVLLNVRGGKGFKNPPRGLSLPEPPKPPAPVAHETPALTSGNVSDVERKFSGGVNTSYLVKLDDAEGTEAVLKPEIGERWGAGFVNRDISRLITNKDFPLAEREAMASEVSVGLGLGELVPETHHRTDIHGIELGKDADDDDDGGGGYDSDQARQEYESYKEKAQEQAIDAVGEEMYELYGQDQAEHVNDIKKRAEELQELWDEERENFVDPDAHGSPSAMREHPALPMGSKPSFHRQEDAGELDPLEMLDEANVDVSYSINATEEGRLRELIRKKLKEGHSGLGEVDEEAAAEHLSYDDWREGHEDTENRLYQSKIQTFTEWRHEQGYQSDDSGGGGERVMNPDAPHPNGGSLQKYVPNLKDYGTLSDEDATKMAVLDYVLGTMDRHAGNTKYVENDEGFESIVAIDNGYSMPASTAPDNFQFRSVPVNRFMASASNREVSEEIRQPIRDAINATDWNALVARHPSMNELERQAFLGRVENMKNALATEDGLVELWSPLDRMPA